jgi:hypothetical protein
MGFSAHNASITVMIFLAAWAACATGESEARARAAEALPQPTKAERHAQKRDVDGVERGGAAHVFAAAHATRQREAKQARQTEGQGAGLKNSTDDVNTTSIRKPLITITTTFCHCVQTRRPPKASVIWRAEPIQNTPTLRVVTH